MTESQERMINDFTERYNTPNTGMAFFDVDIRDMTKEQLVAVVIFQHEEKRFATGLRRK